MSSGGCEGSGEGRERANFIWGGAKIEYVPVPVRSGRCSPSRRMSRIRSRYWYSSCTGLLAVGAGLSDGVSLAGTEACDEGVMTGSTAEGGMLCCVVLFCFVEW